MTAFKIIKGNLTKILIYGVLVVISIVFLIPFLWMLTTAIKTDVDIFAFPPKLLPIPAKFSTFIDAWKMQDFSLFTLNTFKIAFFNIIFSVLSSSITAFGFARLKFPGRRILFVILIATMMIPYEVLVIPQYIGYKYLGWLDTYFPLIIPSIFGDAFFIFLIRQYMMGIPFELDEAAVIDGCNTYQRFFRIMIPLIMPAMTTCIIFQFLWTWNDFFGPLIFLQTQKKWTFTLGIAAFMNQKYAIILWNKMMAMATIFSIIPLVVFALAQKKLIGGIATTGLKA